MAKRRKKRSRTRVKGYTKTVKGRRVRVRGYSRKKKKAGNDCPRCAK